MALPGQNPQRLHTHTRQDLQLYSIVVFVYSFESLSASLSRSLTGRRLCKKTGEGKSGERKFEEQSSRKARD